MDAGIIGAGLMGRWHAAAARHAGARVVAILDRDQTAAQRLAARFPGAQTYAAADPAVLATIPVDVWHICTPPETHGPLAEAALSAGRHVLVEKPLAPTVAETERLLDLAAAQGVLLCPVHQFPFQDGAERARRLLPRLEPLIAFHYAVRSAGAEGQTATTAAEIAAGILPHPLSLIAALLPLDLDEVSWRVVQPGPAEWLVTGAADGVGLSISISMAGRPTVNRCEIVGAGGTLYLDLYHGFAHFEGGVVSRRRKITHPFTQSAGRFFSATLNLGRRTLHREPAYPGLRPLVRRFYAAMRGAAPSPIPAEETLAVARAWAEIRALAAEQMESRPV